jgi:DNA-binding beta-propeller fold protein YncE
VSSRLLDIFRGRGLRAAFLLFVLAGLCGVPGVARAQGDRIYVANQENASVTEIDARSRRVLRTVDLTTLGFSANCKPHHVTVEPDGSFWYVTLITDGVVLKFNRDDSLVGRVSTPVPGMMALDPASDLMLVGRSMSAVNPPSSAMLIRRSTMQPAEELDMPFGRPHGVAVTPDGRWGYVASLSENRLAVVEMATGQVSSVPIPGPTHTVVQVAVSPDGRWLVASGQVSSQLLVFDLAAPAQPAFFRSISVGASPWDPAFSPDGSAVWFANLDANTVTVVNTRDWTVRGVIQDPRLAQPNGLALDPRGRRVYVANRNQHGPAHVHDALPGAGTGFVAVINAGSLRVESILPAGRYAAGVGAAPPSHP